MKWRSTVMNFWYTVWMWKENLPGGKLIDKITTYDEYLESDEMARKRQTYSVETEEED